MENMRNSLTRNSVALKIRGAFQEIRSFWVFAKLHNGEKTLDEVLEHYDPNAKNDNVDSRMLGPKTKVRVRVLLTGRRKVIAWLFLFCWITLVFLVTFYSVTFLEDKTTIVFERIKTTANEIHGSFVETYEELKHPSNPQDVADLMTEFYEMLAKMGYFEPSLIAYPPHIDLRINKTYAEKLGYSQTAIEMMEMLPYLGRGNESEDFFTWSYGAGDNEFILYGTFVDYRQEGFLEEKDPFYALAANADDEARTMAEDVGSYMKPDYILLSTLGNHGAVMVLNTKNYKLWTIDQESGSADFALKDVVIPELSDPLSLDNYPCRSAKLALRDYIQKFIDLEWMPGGLWNGSWTGDEYRRLYVENGWPDHFNRDAFMAARLQWEDEDSQRRDDEQPFEEVKKFQQWVSSTLKQIESKHNAISELDSGKELPPDQVGQQKYRQALIDELDGLTKDLQKLNTELEVAREALRAVDPLVKKSREDRIAKYGY